MSLSRETVVLLQKIFETRILPVVTQHARFKFSRMGLASAKHPDLIQSALCFAWESFLACHLRGKDGCKFPWRLAEAAVRRVKRGDVPGSVNHKREMLADLQAIDGKESRPAREYSMIERVIDPSRADPGQ